VRRSAGLISPLTPRHFILHLAWSTAVDMAQGFIFDAGLLFFAAWAIVLTAVSVIAFGRDIFRIRRRENRENN